MSVCVVNTSLRSVSLLLMQAAMGFKKTKITLQRSNIVAMFKATDLNVCIDITVEPVLGDHPFCPAKTVAQDRWSLITGRTKIIFYLLSDVYIFTQSGSSLK